jgi:hypothetical protein
LRTAPDAERLHGGRLRQISDLALLLANQLLQPFDILWQSGRT